MRKVIVRKHQEATVESAEPRLMQLLATGLQRLYEEGRANRLDTVDFGGDESLTTTCPDLGREGE